MKLNIGTKITCLSPVNKEKHFVVIEFEKIIVNGVVLKSIIIQAILTKKKYKISMNELKDKEKWCLGWK